MMKQKSTAVSALTSGIAGLFKANKVTRIDGHCTQGLYGQEKSGENISFSRWSGKGREFNEEVRKKLEKVREIFLESFYLL